MEPVVYDSAINERGTFAELKTGGDAVMPDGYYNIVLPALLRKDQRLLSPCERGDLERFSALSSRRAGRSRPRARACSTGCCRMAMAGDEHAETLESLLKANGFDPIQHERIQAELRAGHIGLAQNRLPATVQIEDVAPEQLFDARQRIDAKYSQARRRSACSGQLSRWSR